MTTRGTTGRPGRGGAGEGPPWPTVAFVVALLVLGAMLLAGGVSLVSDQLGIGAAAVLGLLWASLAGSLVDIPVARIRSTMPRTVYEVRLVWGGLLVRPVARARETLVAVNLGGAVIPVAASFLLLARAGAWWQAAAAAAVVTVVAFTLARIVPGVGIVLPVWATPAAAALAAVALAPGESAAVAYAAATLGTLVGADLLHLRRVGGLGATVVSIGGAGTFDGIFVGGLVAVALAAL